MKPRAPRALPDSVVFRTRDGQSFHPIQAVMPLGFADLHKGALRPIGTCFPFFSKQNIFVTARHVFENEPIEIMNDQDGSIKCAPGLELVAVCYYPLAGQFGWLPRPVGRLWTHEMADLALGLFTGIEFIKVPHRLVDKVPRRDFVAPAVDERILTFAYPNLRDATTADEVSRRVRETTTARFGYVNKVYPNGRDKLILPSPCIETSLDLAGGMSGGPVFNSQGRLCGINATSFNAAPGEPPVSFVSLLSPLLDMRLPDTKRNLTFSVRELVSIGF